jgi:prevent-host-death family protein
MVICYTSFIMSIKKTIAISDFKARALALVSDVEEHGAEIILTRRGIPVARVIPYLDKTNAPLGNSLSGQAKIVGDIMSLPDSVWGKFLK